MGFDIKMPCEYLVGVLKKLGSTQGHVAIATCQPSGQGVTVLLVSELLVFKIVFLFLGVQWIYIVTLVTVSYIFGSKQLSSFVD